MTKIICSDMITYGHNKNSVWLWFYEKTDNWFPLKIQNIEFLVIVNESKQKVEWGELDKFHSRNKISQLRTTG